tara:strand:- start:1807 stop:2442 length:636 start_codon:yes stop_codon:yes gene_type:complete
MSLEYSFIKNDDTTNKITNKHKNTRKNRKPSKKVKDLLKILEKEKEQKKIYEIHNNDDTDEDEDISIPEFIPPPNPVLTQQRFNKTIKKVEYKPIQTNIYNTDIDNLGLSSNDIDNNNEIDAFNHLGIGDETSPADYNTVMPYFTQATNNSNLHGSRDELMKKLNYMIHLLEENKDERVENVTEELILYMFLGIFVIFIVDSFARAGKYTR